MEKIRIGQLIAPFGPGALYTDSRGIPQIIAGLDHWYKQRDQNNENIDLVEFSIFEPRLSEMLKVGGFRRPADFRTDREKPNAWIYTPVLRFPTWYRNTRTGQLRRSNLDASRIQFPAPNNERWVPVRFVSVCSAGHLGDFPWKEWVRCTCPGDGELYLHDAGGAELSSVRIECTACRVSRSLSGITSFDNEKEVGQRSTFEKNGVQCKGYRPWLGDLAIGEECAEPLVGALINQSNLYFAKVMSSISLPDLTIEDKAVSELKTKIERCEDDLIVAKYQWRQGNNKRAISTIRSALGDIREQAGDELIEMALESLFSFHINVNIQVTGPEVPENQHQAFRREEFNLLRTDINDPVRSPDLRVLKTEVPAGLMRWIDKVHLVERLRETRAFYGFSRLMPEEDPFGGMPHKAMKQLFRHPPQNQIEQWLPAVAVYGEGIYIELSEDAIGPWIHNNRSKLARRLTDGFINRLGCVYQVYPPLTITMDWAARYLLVHSFSHILINQMVFEAGYSSASLKERLYVSADRQAPMAGILIYTAAGDSEGTLGGLVRLGHKERLEPVIRKAISRASWCSADPVCSENLGGRGSRLANLAACHACIMLPETACETMNNGLDRAMIVGTPDDREFGFMSDLLDEMQVD